MELEFLNHLRYILSNIRGIDSGLVLYMTDILCLQGQEVDSKTDDEVFHVPDNESDSGLAEKSSLSEVKDSLGLMKTNPDKIVDGHNSVSREVEFPVPEVNLVDPLLVAKESTSKVIGNEANEATSNGITNEANEAISKVIADEAVKGEIFEDEKDNGLDVFANKCNEVHLNIRLPDFTSLQEKFPLTSALGVVKHYVDENQESSIGSYDLAIPYPRKVFSNEGMNFYYPAVFLYGSIWFCIVKKLTHLIFVC